MKVQELIKLGRYSEVIADLKRDLARNPKDMTAVEGMALVLRAKGELVELVGRISDSVIRRYAGRFGGLRLRLNPPYALPDGQISWPCGLRVSSPLCKNISVFPKCKSGYMFTVLSHRGAARDRHGRGTGCGGRGGAFDERR
jgi:hypothetical protein